MPEPRHLTKLILTATIAVVFIGVLASLSFSTGAATIHPSTADYTTITGTVSGIPSQYTVSATTGNALAFDGNDTIESSAPQNLTQDSWTVCASPQLASDANLNATYDIFAYQNASLLLQYDHNAWSVYYNNSTHSAKATVPAPNPTTGFTQVCSRYNHTANELVVVREDTYSTPEPLTPGVTPRNTSWNWTGRLDELRTHNTATSNASIDAYTTDPIQPLPNTNRSARFMLDEGTGSTTHVYYANTDAQIHGATWTSGLAARAIPQDPLFGPPNYYLESNPFSIKLAAGGYLEGAPVVHISWNAQPLGIPWIELFTALLFTLVLLTIANRIQEHL